jgi:hypothetical protein
LLRRCRNPGSSALQDPSGQVDICPRAFGLYPVTNRRVPHISLVFREMWDTTGLTSNLLKVRRKLPGAPCSHQRCPDFLLRNTNHDHVCGFLSKKAAWSCATPITSTGNPGYVGQKRFFSIAFSRGQWGLRSYLVPRSVIGGSVGLQGVRPTARHSPFIAAAGSRASGGKPGASSRTP